MSEEPAFPSMKSRYKSEFNMGIFDFERLDTILKRIDDMSCEVTSLEKGSILPYFAAIKQLYYFLRPFITLCWRRDMTEKFDVRCDTLWLKVLDWHSEYRNNPTLTDYPLGLVKEFDEFHSDMLTVKQTFGFGLVMNRELAVKTKIRKYLGVRGVKSGRFDKQIKVA